MEEENVLNEGKNVSIEDLDKIEHVSVTSF